MAAMAFIPFAAVRIANTEANGSTADSADNAASERERVCGIASSHCKSGHCDETLKAVLSIVLTDLKSGASFAENNSDKEIYNKLMKLYDSAEELKINGRTEYLPFSTCSQGNTVSDPRYPYLSPAASPWDRFSDEYADAAPCSGVSVEGVDYLCKNGKTAKEALKYYIPAIDG